MTDGIAALNNQRENRRKRQIPPSRNAAKPAPAIAPAEAQQDAPDAVIVEPAQLSTRPQPAPEAEVEDQPAADLARYSIYFDATNDEFLEAVRGAGRAGKPKVDASRSAVARLAIARLQAELSPAEVVAELRRRAPQSKTAGRNRL